MRLDTEIIREIAVGTESVSTENGGYIFSRFTDDELRTTDNLNIKNTAGIALDMMTDADMLDISISVCDPTGIRSYFSLDISVSDKYIGCITNMPQSANTGNYAEKTYPLGRFEGRFELGKGEKRLRIDFPHSVAVKLENIILHGARFISPVKREKTLIAYGDSITQGYDALHPSNTYISRLAEYLGAQYINKALGGALFLPELVRAAHGSFADYIIVAYGTNDWAEDDRDKFIINATAFFTALTTKYPYSDTTVITPIWRQDIGIQREKLGFNDLHNIISEICKRYKNVKVINGLELVPHETKYFGDIRLHPNDAGFEYYFSRLKSFFTM